MSGDQWAVIIGLILAGLVLWALRNSRWAR
jgi:LPXTG-motif cell wall-anchored protein